MNNEGIGRQPQAEPSGMDAIGKPISAEHRERANKHLKDMGIESSGSRFDCISAVSDKLERDKPHEAMKAGMQYVDATGVYRLFASLLAPL